MIHARSDYDSIQDTSGRIPADEPVFVVRGQDPIGWMAVMDWAERARARGVQPELVEAALAHAERMSEYADRVGHGLPDAPLEALPRREDDPTG